MNAEALFSGFKDSIHYILNKYNLGNYNLVTEKYNSALQKYFTCVKAIRKLSAHPRILKDDRMLLRRIEAACLESIGSVFLLIHNEDEAVRYYIRALDAFKIIDDKISISHCYINIGEAYLNQQKYDLAKAYLKQGNDLTMELNRVQDFGLNHQLYGRIYMGLNQMDTSMYHFREAEKEYQLYSQGPGMYENQIYYSQAFLKIGKTDSAEITIIKAIDYFTEQDIPKRLSESLKVLAEIQVAEGRKDLAFQTLEQSHDVQRNVIENAEANMANEMVSFIDDERREFYDSLTILKQDIAAQRNSSELARESYTNKLLLFTLVFLSIVLIAVLIFLRRNKRVNRLLNQALDNNKILFREVHHRVKNNFQIISSLLNLQIGQVDNKKSSVQLEQLKSRIMAMSFVHELLYKTNNTNEIEFKEYATELMESIVTGFTSNHLKVRYEIHTSREYFFNLDTAIPLGLIMNEAITNSVKYAFDDSTEDPLINITLERKDGEYTLQIEDNGIGIPVDTRFKENDTLGLELIEVLTGQLEGEVTFSNDPGTIITIRFRPR